MLVYIELFQSIGLIKINLILLNLSIEVSEFTQA